MTDSDDVAPDLPHGREPRGDTDPAADAVESHWQRLVDDMEGLAAEYRERGWDAYEIHPGDVTAITDPDDGRRGFDILAPDNEFDSIEAAVETSATFDNATVYRATTNGVLFLLVALEDDTTETVVFVPAYYSPPEEQDVVDYLTNTDAVQLHVRPLDQRTILTFEHDDPSLFLPDEGE